MHASGKESSTHALVMRGVLVALKVFVLFLLFASVLLLTPPAFWLTIYHGIAGWLLFLIRNLKGFSLDAHILLSGLVTFGLAIVIFHTLARWWFKNHEMRWRARNSIIACLFVPVLFGTSFLVPGILMMVRTPMAETFFISSGRGSVRAGNMMQLRNFAYLLNAYMVENEQGHYPADIEPVLKILEEEGSTTEYEKFLNNGFLYLAAGKPTEGNEPLLVAASPIYQTAKGPERAVIHRGWKLETLSLAEFEQHLDEQTGKKSAEPR